MYFFEDLRELPQQEVINLLSAYDMYIQDANEEDLYKSGWRPVCIEEFYDNEYKIEKD